MKTSQRPGLLPSLLEYRAADRAEIGFLPPQAGGDRLRIRDFAGTEPDTSGVQALFCSGVASSANAEPVASNPKTKPSANAGRARRAGVNDSLNMTFMGYFPGWAGADGDAVVTLGNKVGDFYRM